MIRVLLYSHDAGLLSLLAPTLDDRFSIVIEEPIDKIREIISQGRCDILVLDLDSGSDSILRQPGFLNEIRDCNVPIVAMTNEDGRATAMELVQYGVHNFMRRSQALQELKTVVRRMHEYAALRRDLEDLRQRLHRSNGSETGTKAT